MNNEEEINNVFGNLESALEYLENSYDNITSIYCYLGLNY